MQEMLSVLDRVAASSCTVLVTGESGTGKELAVAALHDASPRAGRPLVAVNCGAIPENLVESELFGHARGAFTGATHARAGLVAAAEGGTLFLDEVGELPLAAQVKLLRLLQAREYTPVGESRARQADVRIVAATHRDLRREVAEGRFREDFFYRLNVIHVRIPALRERREDIPRLAEHFLRSTAERVGREDVTSFSPEALDRLVRGEWHGNVRALENAIERAVLLSDGPVVDAALVAEPPRRIALVEQRGADIPVPTPAAAPPPPVVVEAEEADELALATIDLRAAVEAYENSLIRAALERAGNNKTRAAQFLGLHRTTLVEMLKRKGLDSLPKAAA